jgi:hypothetical protein
MRELVPHLRQACFGEEAGRGAQDGHVSDQPLVKPSRGYKLTQLICTLSICMRAYMYLRRSTSRREIMENHLFSLFSVLERHRRDIFVQFSLLDHVLSRYFV